MGSYKLDALTERYAFCDPASGKKERELKRIRARSAIVVVAQDSMSRIFVLHTWAARATTEELIEKMYEINDGFKPRVFGGESNGMQSLFQDAVIRDARLRGKHIPLQKVEQPTTTEKDTRIRHTIQPVIAAGRLFIRDDMTELKTEMEGFPLTPFKDLVDALASAIRLIPPTVTKPEKRAELDDLLDYLRATGAPPSYIEQVARDRGIRR